MVKVDGHYTIEVILKNGERHDRDHSLEDKLDQLKNYLDNVVFIKT
jgi:hypothetical protein